MEMSLTTTGNPNAGIYACSQNWLETTTGGQYENMQTIGYCQPTYNCWPYYYPVYFSSTARPIKLTLSEVERLREAAKADEKLKTILAKFTNQIEITVDFD